MPRPVLTNVCVCVFQTHVEQLPEKEATMNDLNSRQMLVSVPAEKLRDIKMINTRWSQVS